MASSTAKPMPQTIEAYKELAQRDLELIDEQQREIGQLKAKVNKLEQLWASKDVARYNYLFIDGFDYHELWLSEPKETVDKLIDNAINTLNINKGDV